MKRYFFTDPAFTLVELLLGLAILGLLTGFVLPSLPLIQEKVQIARDVSNLKQIGVGLLSYAGDNNNLFPAAGGRIPWGQTSPITGAGPWEEQLAPYLNNNTNIFLTRRKLGTNIPARPWPTYFLGTRPAMAAERSFGPVHLARLHAPSQTILGGLVAAPGMFQTDDWDKDDYTQSPAFGPDKKSRLPGPVPILFADGHVRECSFFDTNSMTTEYEKGRWYGF